MTKEYSNKELNKLPFMDDALPLETRVDDLLNRLTIDEKFKLLTGRHMWETSPIKRLGIKPFLMTDGPHGVAPHSSGGKEATYFPVGICRAATWNRSLCYEFGKALAAEVRDIGGHMILGPGVNIIRTPMCGRNFEYQTEDPYLNKELAVQVIKGIQSERIAACVKHYICNNQETNRYKYSAELSRRALEEIYYPAFKGALKEANVLSVMGAYNKINGIYACEHEELIKKQMMDKWGFEGFMVSDWNATEFIEKPEHALNARLTLEMPRARLYKRRNLKEAFSEEKFSIETLDDHIRRLLRVMFYVGLFCRQENLPKGSRNTENHQNLAREIAEEGIVLLKNQHHLLPLNKSKIRKIAIKGPNANKKLAEGGGSSSVRPPYEITPYHGIKEKCGAKIDIINNISEADVVFLVVGLDHQQGNDCENADRTSFKLPKDQIDLINKSVEENSNTIIILINGSPISMKGWIEKVPAIIEAWYPGLEGGRALADIIFGNVNPSGKLPITLPKELSDSLAHSSQKSYPGTEDGKVYYDEDIFVGYRYFDTKNIDPLFPFGFGLSYTSFHYANLQLDKKYFSGNDRLNIKIDIINSGSQKGSEITQLYIQDFDSSVKRPIKELKGFSKVNLKPNQKRSISFKIDKKDLAFYNQDTNSWTVEDGRFDILIANSSKDIHLKGSVVYKGN
jgi:beta-glucosidase